MRGARVIALGISLLSLGCPVRSLQPLFEDKDLVFEPSLVGTWNADEGKETYTFRRSGDKGYEALCIKHESSGSGVQSDTSFLKVQTGRLGKYLFLDSFPARGTDDFHMLRTHMISKIGLKGDTLRVSSLESDRLSEMIDSGKLQTPHARLGGDIVLTGSTAELKQFVLRYADDNKAFPEPGKLVRAR